MTQEDTLAGVTLHLFLLKNIWRLSNYDSMKILQKWLLRSGIFSGGPSVFWEVYHLGLFEVKHTYVIHGSTGYSFVCSRSKRVDRCAVF